MSETQNSDWKSTEKTLRSIQAFHDKYAKYPKVQIEEAKVKFVEYMSKLEKAFQAVKLCNRLAYTGSTYENLKIVSGDLEFDVMFIRDGKGLEIVPIASMSGYAFLKPSQESGEKFSGFLDAQERLSPSDVVSSFFGSVQKIVNDERLNKMIKLRMHGPAIQIDVLKNEGDSKPWFTVDLVVAYEIEDHGKRVKFVPKGIKHRDREDLNSAWRLSFSEEEKARLDGMDRNNGCRKKTLRIVKAICKQEDTFQILKSYDLKTVLLHATDNGELKWLEADLAYRVFGLFHDLQGALEKKMLKNYHISEMNLFESLQPIAASNLADRIRRLLRSEKEFMKLLDATRPSPPLAAVLKY